MLVIVSCYNELTLQVISGNVHPTACMHGPFTLTELRIVVTILHHQPWATFWPDLFGLARNIARFGHGIKSIAGICTLAMHKCSYCVHKYGAVCVICSRLRFSLQLG